MYSITQTFLEGVSSGAETRVRDREGLRSLNFDGPVLETGTSTRPRQRAFGKDKTCRHSMGIHWYSVDVSVGYWG